MNAGFSRRKTRAPGSAGPLRGSRDGAADEGRRQGQNHRYSRPICLIDPCHLLMLTRLSIRDIVLIERLDIDFAKGLAALTGETGAGKSILLDAFALALGARGDVALVRHGVEQGQVTAAFDLSDDHPVRALIDEHGIPSEDELILRRVQLADGRTRA